MIWRRDKTIGFDVETAGDQPAYGLQPFRKLHGEARMTMASFARREPEAAGVITRPDRARLTALFDSIIAQDLTIVGWNVVFDASWLIAYGLEEQVFAAKWLDAMWLWKHWKQEPESELPRGKRKSYSLKAAMHEFFPEDTEFKEFDNFDATEDDPVAWAKLIERNKKDAMYTLDLAEMFWGKLTDRQQMAALVEARCIPDVARTRVVGLDIDRDATEELDRVLDQEYTEKFEQFAAEHPEILDMNSPTKAQLRKDSMAMHLNVSSPPQLQKILYDIWELPCIKMGPVKKDGTQSKSADKEVLYELAFDYPQVRMIQELRNAKNSRAKYATATLNSLDYNGDGRTRPEAKPYGTYTGRMTYSSKMKG